MRSFLEWFDAEGFWVNETWDYARAKFGGAGYLTLSPEQRRILAYALTPNALGQLPIQTLLYSAPKKSGKTTIAAAITAWAAAEFQAGSEIYIIANDKEQAESRVFRDLVFHVEHAIEDAYIISDQIEFPNGTQVTVLAKEYKSAAGGRHALTVWDELWGYVSEQGQRMWAEMTPVPTVPISLRVIVTYAGFENESNLLWELYLRGVGVEEHYQGRGQDVPGFDDLPVWQNKKLLCYWDHEHRQPWQTDEYYAEEIENLRASDLLRLHDNRWSSSTEAFIPVEWWHEAEKAYETGGDLWAAHPYRLAQIFVGVDVAPKHDCSAVVGVTYDEAKGIVVLLFHHIWTPAGELDLEATVEQFIIDHSRRYAFGSVDYDPAQFHRSMLTLRKNHKLPMRQFVQNGDAMIRASQQLYDLLKGRRLKAYPDPECAAHIKNATARNTARGFRIEKDPLFGKSSNKKLRTAKPVDFAIALAMACYAAIELGVAPTDANLRIESPFSDVSAWPHRDPRQLALPLPFRED